MLARQLQQESFQIENLAGVYVKKVGFRRFSPVASRKKVLEMVFVASRKKVPERFGCILWFCM